MDIDWNHKLHEQLDWHWQHHLRPRLEGLTDEEYFWEPVTGCWNIHPRGKSRASMAVGSGDFTIDFALPEPEPAPVTTIAWRMAHIIVGIFGERAASHFGGPAMDYQSFAYAGTVDEALAQLEEGYRRWGDGVRGLGAEGLGQPCGEAEGPFAERPLAELVLHINRETIHHGAEICLLRDLYAHRNGKAQARS